MWSKIRRVWITVGVLGTIVFVVWSLVAFRASGEALVSLQGDTYVAVERAENCWTFQPRADVRRTGLVFFAGAMVDPRAYAPLAHRIAGAGYPVLLMELPRRGAFGGADGPEVLDRATAAQRKVPGVDRWVAAGHSRGGEVAARFAARNPGLAGLVLIGTSHPRDFSLAASTIPVTRVFGTRDTVADVEKLEATRGNLPAAARLVEIDGGNHSQFGYYGFQPGDWPATISREEQQRITLEAVLDALKGAERQ